MVTHCDIGKPISSCNYNFADTFAKLVTTRDLVKLYNVETRTLNQAVKNNLEKFPERFSWKLTEEESKIFLVKNFDQKIETRGGRYKTASAFTEQGG